MVSDVGEERFVNEVQTELKNGQYHPLPARRKEIPKGDDKMRPLGTGRNNDREDDIDDNVHYQPANHDCPSGGWGDAQAGTGK